MKLLMLKGLPASGKSTFARTLVDKGWLRTNKDDLRTMMLNGRGGGKKEGHVITIRNAVIEHGLSKGLNVVVDDTNFNPIHEAALREMAKTHSAQFEVKFFDTPIEECIERDLKRANSVGEKVIRQMYNQYLAPPSQAYHPPEDKPSAILCDIDGTLAHMVSRGPFDWGCVGEDILDDSVKCALDAMKLVGQIILLSGRDGVCRPETEEWLERHGVKYDLLIMRAEGDNRKDSIVKRELFDSHIRDKYQVSFVLDDRNQVVEMWRQMGLKCFQVADGNF